MTVTLQHWSDAIRAAKDGRPDALADLVEAQQVPVPAREGLAAYIRTARTKNTGRAPEPRNAAGNTSLLERQADVYEAFHTVYPARCSDPEEAVNLVAIKPHIPPTRVKALVMNKHTRLNRVLEERGTKRPPVRFQEAS
jgi:hypothetical protein